MSKTLLIGGFAVVALAAAAGAATAQQPVERPAPRAAQAGPVSRADFVERRVERLAAADADGDGTVTPDERRARAVAMRSERAEARFARLDTDRDGKLSREEFVARAERAAGEGRPQRMRRGHHPEGGQGMRGGDRGPVVIADVRARADQAFTRLDSDSDGFLSVEERRAARETMREHRRDRGGQRRVAREASPPAPASE
ncbi:EF-hand domain-containing protein [Brevundimonas sp.]|jgi:Ca2+-binding EF-hand superfamily protein|uniref:EF-hand domain-containing protein n=1 Tax=Brevundimonas sp. TaxID=1871086 RepID=UPI002ED87888